MAVSDWSEDPDQNDLVLGIDIGENCPADNVNNAMRVIMAQIAAWIKGAIFTGITKIRDVAGDTGNAVLRFYDNAGTTLRGYIDGRPGGGLAFGNGTTEVMRFTSLGRLGIGTVAPNWPLHVAGDIGLAALRFTNNANAYVYSDANRSSFQGDTNDSYSYDRVNNLHEFYIGGTRQGYFDGAGRVVAASEVVATTLIRAGGFTNFFMNYNGGNPYISFANNSYIQFDAVNNLFNFVIGGVARGQLNANGWLSNGFAVPAIIAQSLGNIGYIKWSNGMWEMWGTLTVPASTFNYRVNYPAGVSLTSWSNVQLTGGGGSLQDNDPYATAPDTGGFYITNRLASQATVWWQAKGY